LLQAEVVRCEKWNVFCSHEQPYLQKCIVL